MDYVPSSAPLSIGGVIDDAIRLFRAAWSRCWFLAIVPGLASMLFTLALPLRAATDLARNPKPTFADLLQFYESLFTPRIIGFYFLLIILSIIFQGAVLAREAAIAAGNENASMGDAIGTGVRQLLWMIVGGIIFSIVVCLGFFALLIPGIWLWGRLMLWPAAVFVDGQNALEGLGTSWRLTSGNWWRATVIVSVAIIIAIVLAFVFSIVGATVAGIVGAVTHMGVRTATFVGQIFSIAGNAVYVPLMMAMWIALYRDLKLRRQGGDLASRAAALGSAA